MSASLMKIWRIQRNLDQDHCLGAWMECKAPSGIRCASFAAASPLSAALNRSSERGGVASAAGTADKNKQGLCVIHCECSVCVMGVKQEHAYLGLQYDQV